MDLIVLDFIETEYFMSGMPIFMTGNFVDLGLLGSTRFHIDYVLGINLADVHVIKKFCSGETTKYLKSCSNESHMHAVPLISV